MLSSVVFFDILEGLDFTNTLGLLILAFSIFALIWVIRLEHKWVCLNVCESLVHESTIAAFVLLGAVNQLLLGE